MNAENSVDEMEVEVIRPEAERKQRRYPLPPPSARCVKCGSAEVNYLPTYSAGSGIVDRPLADDVICRRCSFIAPPLYDLPC